MVILSLQYSTQWDGLAYAGPMFDTQGDGITRPVYYNEFAAVKDIIGPEKIENTGIPVTLEDANTASFHALDIVQMSRKAGQGRGVLLDLRAYFGDKRKLVGHDDIIKILEKDKIEVTQGDIRCLHQGFVDLIQKMNQNPDKEKLETSSAVLNRTDEKLLQWLTDTKIAVLTADNYAVKAFPTRNSGYSCAVLPLHEHCLFRIGLDRGELWNLTPLADWLRSHNRYRFHLTAPSLDLPGGLVLPLTLVAPIYQTAA